MADPKWFLAKAGRYVKGRPRSKPLLDSILDDKIKLQNMSRDAMDVFMYKRMKSLKKFDKMKIAFLTSDIQDDKEEGSPISSRTLSSETLKSRDSTGSLSDISNALSRKQSREMLAPIPHGFRYHSNGDERLPRKLGPSDIPALPSYVTDSNNWELVKQAIAKVASSYVDRKCENNYNPDDCYDSPAEINQAFKGLSPDDSYGNLAQLQDINTTLNKAGDKPESASFRGESWKTKGGARKVQTRSQGPSGEPPESTKASSQNAALNAPTRRASLQPNNSSFNMRYGVSSQLLASRRPVLDELKAEELERSAITNAKVEDFINNIERMNSKRNKQQKVEAFAAEYGTIKANMSTRNALSYRPYGSW